MNKIKCIFLKTLFLIATIPFVSQAAPWIGTNNQSLHNDLKTLVEYGYLDTVTMSYPIPWQGIASQVKTLEINNNVVAEIALSRLQRYLRQRDLLQYRIQLNASSEVPRFTSFEDNQREKAEFSIQGRFESASLAGQLTLNTDSEGEDHLGQSYLMARFDDWHLGVQAIDQWWGPGESTSFILTNNARPVPVLAITTSQPTTDEDSWLSFLGPWYFTAQLGQLNDDRVVADTKLWRTRFNFRPFESIEFGLSWTAMWGGEGFGNSFSDFIDVITFQPNCADGSQTCSDELDTKQGNQLAGIDFKYRFKLFETPGSFYLQTIGEDAKDYIKITDRVYMYGLSSYFWDSRFYIETSDTTVSCGSRTSTTNNCFYEHGDYQTGYRHYGRAIGSTFDSDAKVATLGMRKHYLSGDELHIKVDSIELNQDSEKPSPVVIGNSEKITRISAAYLFRHFNWTYKLTGVVLDTDADYTANGLSEVSDTRVLIDIVYEF